MRAILSRRSAQWILFNLLGMAAYLGLASRLWVPVSEFGEPGGPGDAFFIAFILWPVLISFAILNFIALAFILRRLMQGNRSCAIAHWVAVSSSWVAVMMLDHHLAFNIVGRHYV